MSSGRCYFKLLIHLTVIITIKCEILDFLNIFSDTEYPKNDLRAKFLNEKKRNNASSTRVKLLDQIMANESVYVDSIMHYNIKHMKMQDYLKMRKIDNDFKNLIAMNGLTYIYKRDVFWRTWRSVEFSDAPHMIYYKCESAVNCSGCNKGGYWNLVEEIPPCPYEIFSLTDDGRPCVANLSQLPDIDDYYNKCTSNISIGDLMATCNNPIETDWRITKKISSGYESLLYSICGELGLCSLFTIYTITPEHIAFRIINSTDHVVYSKIMKNGGKNYACVTNCGIYDRVTKTIIPMSSDIPLVINLIKKTKRENPPIFYEVEPSKFVKPIVRVFGKKKMRKRQKSDSTISCRRLRKEYENRVIEEDKLP